MKVLVLDTIINFETKVEYSEKNNCDVYFYKPKEIISCKLIEYYFDLENKNYEIVETDKNCKDYFSLSDKYFQNFEEGIIFNEEKLKKEKIGLVFMQIKNNEDINGINIPNEKNWENNDIKIKINDGEWIESIIRKTTGIWFFTRFSILYQIINKKDNKEYIEKMKKEVLEGINQKDIDLNIF